MDKQVSLCYALLRAKYEPWCISFELSNSSQDYNFGMKFIASDFPESKKPKNFIYSDWGHTPEEAIEKIIYRIIEDEYDDKKEKVEKNTTNGVG